MDNAAAAPVIPRLAATVMVVRSARRGGFEVYMLRRNRRSRFMPDVYVFPGGAVDADDRTLAESTRVRRDALAVAPELKVAALRELFEEAGLLLALSADGSRPLLDRSALESLRARLRAGAPLGELLAEASFILDLGALVHYSNWITPLTEPIRVDTHFFIARGPDDQIAAADAIEVHDGRWITPDDAIADARAGRMPIAFPTLRHLERLAQFDDLETLLAHARTRRVKSILPFEGGPADFAFLENGEW